jgi:hypothetical protein
VSDEILNPNRNPISIFLSKEDYLTKRVADEIKNNLGPDVLKTFLGQCKEVSPGGLALWMQDEFMNGLAFWAIGKMGQNVTKYVDNGCENFLALFRMALMLAASPMAALDSAWFLFPLLSPKRPVHPAKWIEARNLYTDILGPIEVIKKKKWRNPAALFLTLKGKLPGITDSDAKKWAGLKASDIALKYVCKTFKLPVDIEALQKYFRHFDSPHEHLTFVSRDIRKQREQYR